MKELLLALSILRVVKEVFAELEPVIIRLQEAAVTGKDMTTEEVQEGRARTKTALQSLRAAIEARERELEEEG